MLGKLLNYHLVNPPLAANVFTKSSRILMVQWKGIKLGQWLRAILKEKAQITWKPFKTVSVRVLLSIASVKGWPLHQYIKGTPGQWVYFPMDSDLQLKAFQDADWAGCPYTRKSLTGYFVFLGNALVPWRSKKQSIISRFSVDAKYRSMTTTTCEIIWLLYLLENLHVLHGKPSLMYRDNQTAL